MRNFVVRLFCILIMLSAVSGKNVFSNSYSQSKTYYFVDNKNSINVSYTVYGEPQDESDWLGLLQIKENGRLVFEQENNWLSINRFCYDKPIGQLSILFSYGYYPIEGRFTAAAYSNNGQWQSASLLEDRYNPQVENLNLANFSEKNIVPHTIKESPTPSLALPECDLSEAKSDQDILNNWEAFLTNSETTQLTINLTTVDGQELSHNIERLDVPNTQLESHLEKLTNHLHGSSHVIYENGEDRFVVLDRDSDPYDSLSEVLWKHDSQWYMFNVSGQSSKGITKLLVAEQTESGSFPFRCVSTHAVGGEFIKTLCLIGN